MTLPTTSESPCAATAFNTFAPETLDEYLITVRHWSTRMGNVGRHFAIITTAIMRTGESSACGTTRLQTPAPANAMITLTVYQHVHPGMGRQAADRFAALLSG